MEIHIMVGARAGSKAGASYGLTGRYRGPVCWCALVVAVPPRGVAAVVAGTSMQVHSRRG